MPVYMVYRGLLYRFDHSDSALFFLQKLSWKESYPDQFGGVVVSEELHVIEGENDVHEAARVLRGRLPSR